jgi:hypothetical protein
MELISELGWLVTCSVVLMNTDSFSFLAILFPSLWMTFALSHCILSSFHENYAILDFIISLFLSFIYVR